MFDPSQYQLLDFGNCRRLERFGPLLLDRVCPAAESVRPIAPQLWASADARFTRSEGERGDWTPPGRGLQNWTIAHGPLGEIECATDLEATAGAASKLTFALKLTNFGHVGLFPEQSENWDWIAAQLRRSPPGASSPIRVLNLFAYTGGSTLAAAAGGARVTQVDAARNINAWARHNAQLSGLGAAPIRWISEDAMKFVTREVRRGNRYEAVILDPPSYGHGARGEVWRLVEDLPRLLAFCAQLTQPKPRFVLLSCHTPGVTAAHLHDLLTAAFGAPSRVQFEVKPLLLTAATGQKLPSGVVARWRSLE